MAIAFQKVSQTAAATGSSFNVSITSNSAGDLLILGIGVFQSSQIQSVTDRVGQVRRSGPCSDTCDGRRRVLRFPNATTSS